MQPARTLNYLMMLNIGDVLGTFTGSRSVFTGRTPMLILSASLMPSLYLMLIANCRQICSAEFLAVSLSCTVTGVRVPGAVATLNATSNADTAAAMPAASAAVSPYIDGFALMPPLKASIHCNA